MSPRRAAFLWLGAFVGWGCGQGRFSDRVERSSAPVIGGSDDTTHDAIVSIVTVPTAPAAELCTGVVVAPRVVLTAGHCVQLQTASTLTVGVGPNAGAPARTLAVSSVGTVPRFVGDLTIDKPAGHDLGVVILSEDAGVTPVALARTAPAASATVRLIGYGLSDPANVDTRGTRRLADVTLGERCALLVSFGNATTNACHGDSGAPLLRTAADGTDEIVGIVSYGKTASCDPPSYAVRVDAYAAWIDAVIAHQAIVDCSTCPPEAPDCPPGGGADAALDGAPDVNPSDAADAASDAAIGTGARAGCTSARGNTSLAHWLTLALAMALHARRRRAPRR